MNQETVNAIKEALVPVAEKIGQGAEFGWEVVVRQQYVYGAIGLFFAVLSLVLVFVAIVPWYKDWARRSKSENYAEPDIVGIVFVAGAALTGVITGSITAITHFINPHYYAIQSFIGLVK